jgi:hypothetical protein
VIADRIQDDKTATTSGQSESLIADGIESAEDVQSSRQLGALTLSDDHGGDDDGFLGKAPTGQRAALQSQGSPFGIHRRSTFNCQVVAMVRKPPLAKWCSGPEADVDIESSSD